MKIQDSPCDPKSGRQHCPWFNPNVTGDTAAGRGMRECAGDERLLTRSQAGRADSAVSRRTGPVIANPSAVMLALTMVETGRCDRGCLRTGRVSNAGEKV